MNSRIGNNPCRYKLSRMCVNEISKLEVSTLQFNHNAFPCITKYPINASLRCSWRIQFKVWTLVADFLKWRIKFQIRKFLAFLKFEYSTPRFGYNALLYITKYPISARLRPSWRIKFQIRRFGADFLKFEYSTP